ncbi:MAG: sensor histidine kinase [Planktomarina sp.]|nr:sensor histidine kinase [Planktomarina sp.]
MTEGVKISGSLRNRLTVTLISGAAVLALLIYFIVRTYATQIAQQGQDNILGASVNSILDAANVSEGFIDVDFPYASFSMLGTDTDDRVFYAIYQDDELLSGYDGLTQIFPEVDKGSVYDNTTFQGAPVRLASASRMLVGADLRAQLTVTVAQTQDSLSGALNRIGRNVAIFGAGFFLLVVILAFWATSTAIAPLAQLTTSVARRGPQDLSPVANPIPREMAPLVFSLNKLMARLEYSLSRSEDFITEAAHRVRTPLATVRSHAEATLLRVDKEENRQSMRSMIRAIDESSRAAGQLLDHAMITFRADNLDQKNIDLVELVQDLAIRLAPIAEIRDIELQLDALGPIPVIGDEILLQNAIRNLVDNALKYAPSESIVRLVVANTIKPSISVVDEGAGFPVGEINSLQDRFARGSNSGGIIGSGLGLTIAQEVAEAHGGGLTLTNHSGGGACVIFSF